MTDLGPDALMLVWMHRTIPPFLAVTAAFVTWRFHVLAAREDLARIPGHEPWYDAYTSVTLGSSIATTVLLAIWLLPALSITPLAKAGYTTIATGTLLQIEAALIALGKFGGLRLRAITGGRHPWQQPATPAQEHEATEREAAQVVTQSSVVQPAPTTSRPPVTIRTGGKHVLLIEDTLDVQDVVATMLRGAGYTVTTAANGDEGLDRLRDGPRPDAIVLDLRMPGKDGFGFRLEQLAHADWATIPTIVLSAHPEIRTAAHGHPFYLERVLEKPIETETLVAAIEGA